MLENMGSDKRGEVFRSLSTQEKNLLARVTKFISLSNNIELGEFDYSQKSKEEVMEILRDRDLLGTFEKFQNLIFVTRHFSAEEKEAEEERLARAILHESSLAI